MLFTPGTGTLKSTTLEGAFVEAMVLLQTAEEAARLVDPTISNSIAVNFFTGDKTVTVEIANLAVDSFETVNGRAYQGANYFNDQPLPSFSNTGSELKATSLPAAVTELAQKLAIQEFLLPADATKNISASLINVLTLEYSFAAQFNVTMIRSATGATEFAVISYLA